MNEFNDKGVCRTTLATLGLLDICNIGNPHDIGTVGNIGNMIIIGNIVILVI